MTKRKIAPKSRTQMEMWSWERVGKAWYKASQKSIVMNGVK